MKLKKVLAAALAFTMMLPTVAFADGAGLQNFTKSNTYTQGQFKDVASGAWYAKNVQAAYEYGLVKGSSANTFSPAGNLTIAEAVALACRLHITYNDNGTVLESSSPWYQSSVDYAVENGIINAGTYSNYNKAATRAQFAQILGAALPDEAMPALNNITSIPDVPTSASYAGAVYRLYNAGIIKGSDAYGTYNPGNNIQRSEVATIVTLMADASKRSTFTLAEKPKSTGNATLDALRGVWYNDGDGKPILSLTEIYINGDEYIHTTHGVTEGYYRCYKGKVTDLLKNYNNEYPYVVFWSGTKEYIKNGQPAQTENITANGASNTNLSYALKLKEIGKDYFQESGMYGRRYERTSKPALYEEFLQVSGNNEDKWDDIKFYKEYPTVPDFGDFYDLKLVDKQTGGAGSYTAPTTVTGNSKLDSLLYETGTALEQLDKKVDPYTAYYYSYEDFMWKNGFLYEEYTDLLEECGFKPAWKKAMDGDMKLYYEKAGISVRIYTSDYDQYISYKYSNHLDWEEQIIVQVTQH